jgi:lysophospholipase L1-like esterase
VASTTVVAVDQPASVVVIGDSLAGTGWVELYRAHLESALGRAVEAEVLNGMTVPEALETVSAEGTPAQEALAAADVIIVQTGFNNALPDPETGIGCGGSLGSDLMVWIRSTEPGCLAEGVATYGALYDAIFAGVEELRAGQPSVFIATGTIDGNIDVNTDGLVAAVAEADRAEALDWTLAAYERWNSMLSERAAAAGFTYVDLYHAFNGPDGTRPPGDLSSDGAHPSAKGDRLIAEMLAEVDLSTLG